MSYEKGAVASIIYTWWFVQAERTGVVNAVYEARPMIGDHKADNKEENIARGPQC